MPDPPPIQPWITHFIAGTSYLGPIELISTSRFCPIDGLGKCTPKILANPWKNQQKYEKSCNWQLLISWLWLWKNWNFSMSGLSRKNSLISWETHQSHASCEKYPNLVIMQCVNTGKCRWQLNMNQFGIDLVRGHLNHPGWSHICTKSTPCWLGTPGFYLAQPHFLGNLAPKFWPMQFLMGIISGVHF